MKNPLIYTVFIFLLTAGCSLFYEDFAVSATVDGDKLMILANIHNYHGDFVHMSIRKTGYDNNYGISVSPEAARPEYDWSRVHHWFGVLNPDTFLEGRIDNGWGRGPLTSREFQFELPLAAGTRTNHIDQYGSNYEYITMGYSYADGHASHPAFSSGDYVIAIYPWYTGRADATHPSSDEHEEVQYIHYEDTLATSTFSIP